MSTEGVPKREAELEVGVRAPANHNELQVWLAAELFRKKAGSEERKSFEDESSEYRRSHGNEVMAFWIKPQNGFDSYSQAFRGLVDDPKFSTHPRFSKDPLAVTLDDVEYYRRHDELPAA